MENETTDVTKRYLEFKLGDEHYAIPLLQVRELISVPETTNVPFSPSYYVGIMNLRGQVISIIDLRTRLGVKPAESNEEAVIIVEFGQLCLGIVVDNICKVLSVDEEQIQEVASVETKKRDRLNRVYRNNEALIQLVDLESILNIDELNGLVKKAA
ncbi:CheW-like protein [Bacteriovorax sp. BAL6_X]|uniref:chemotaxis protein CheW n=1 Tax=Bacteriovorax sp. BAL6_X TaxID=1201290 RepID=UPI000386749A|nr:chemotaxis protein CheW [Bacteriovorax sp. BAL6_X]EPZ49352.1 CheW-like protein [Bacteriovorax sp. BAL6_X]